MPFDAICISAVVKELQSEIEGSRIDKIYQTEKDEINLLLYGHNGSKRLLISAAQGNARIHLTQTKKDNPQNPPMFCMLLRKHISGARINSITQWGLDRVIILSMDCYDELGVAVQKQLILEAIGKSCNLALVDNTGRIVDCIRRTGGDISAARSMLPGMFYHFPEGQKKLDPREASEDVVKHLFSETIADQFCDKWLLDNFFGISPLIARELVFRAGVEGKRLSELNEQQKDALCAQMICLRECVNEESFEPWLIKIEEKAKDFSFMPILQYGPNSQNVKGDSFSQMLDSFYEHRDRMEYLRQRSKETIRAVKSARDRTKRKLENQREELRESLDRDFYRKAGDIITANIYAMQKGMASLTAVDFYDENAGEIEIKLDPLKTPQQNAAAYYKTYTKLRTAEKYLAEQIKKNENELNYLESVLDELERAESKSDIFAIRSELEQSGYFRQNRKKHEKPQYAKPYLYCSSAGLKIAVGRNNIQNDELTLKTAEKRDIWLHTQKIHGSHVILFTKGKEPDELSITEAAMLAAWHSQARLSTNVPVDYTMVKYVKKPNGAKAGMVVYETYNTAFVTPDEKIIEKLRENGQS